MVAAKHSAGILLYRFPGGPHDRRPEVLLAHMGGPFWADRDAGAWSLPKGLIEAGEEPLEAARREFEEELGQPPPEGEMLPLGTIRQASGKRVTAFALQGDLDVAAVRSNTVEIEWPRGSGRTATFPEIDRAGWFEVAEARERVVVAQAALIDRLVELLAAEPAPAG